MQHPKPHALVTTALAFVVESNTVYPTSVAVYPTSVEAMVNSYLLMPPLTVPPLVLTVVIL